MSQPAVLVQFLHILWMFSLLQISSCFQSRFAAKHTHSIDTKAWMPFTINLIGVEEASKSFTNPRLSITNEVLFYAALAILAAILLFIVASQRTSLDSPPETENQNSAVPSDTNVSPEGKPCCSFDLLYLFSPVFPKTSSREDPCLPAKSNKFRNASLRNLLVRLKDTNVSLYSNLMLMITFEQILMVDRLIWSQVLSIWLSWMESSNPIREWSCSCWSWKMLCHWWFSSSLQSNTF